MSKNKTNSSALFAKPKDRLPQNGQRFRDKLRRALGASIRTFKRRWRRLVGKRGSKQRRIVNIALVALFTAASGCLLFHDPAARKLFTLLSSKAKSSLHSLTSETLDPASNPSTLDSSSRTKYLYFIVGAICIVANAIIWQYDENGQIRCIFQPAPEPENTSRILKILDQIYEYLPETVSQLLILLGEIGGIFLGIGLVFVDIVHGGPICFILENMIGALDSIIDLFQ